MKTILHIYKRHTVWTKQVWIKVKIKGGEFICHFKMRHFVPGLEPAPKKRKRYCGGPPEKHDLFQKMKTFSTELCPERRIVWAAKLSSLVSVIWLWFHQLNCLADSWMFPDCEKWSPGDWKGLPGAGVTSNLRGGCVVLHKIWHSWCPAHSLIEFGRHLGKQFCFVGGSWILLDRLWCWVSSSQGPDVSSVFWPQFCIVKAWTEDQMVCREREARWS